MITYNIPTSNVDGFKKAIEKLHKKAIKLGVTPPTVSFVDGFTRKYFVDPISGNELVFPIFIDYTVVEVTDIEPPKYAGWTFVAQIEHDNDGRSMIFKVPGMEIDEKYFTNLDNTCNHCNTHRRRKNTYVVRHDDGDEKRVGSTCIKDFLGHEAPTNIAQRFANLFNYYNTFSSFGNLGEKYEFSISRDAFLAYTSAAIRQFGWLSRKVAAEEGGISTADRVVKHFDGIPHSAEERLTAYETDNETAEKTVEWARSLDPTKSDFNYNIKTIAEKEYLKRKHYGFAAAMVYSYLRYLENQRIRANQTNELSSEYVGEVGVRTKFENVKLVNAFQIDGGYGLTTIYKFIKDNKDIIVWFSTSSRVSLDIDEVYTINGTVKAHNEYKGKKQTIVNRVKAVK
jgi:hypothetical protein